MALNVRPILSSISAFDADFGTLEKAPILKFSWYDGLARKNQVVIKDYETNEIVYDCTIVTNMRTHQLHKKGVNIDEVSGSDEVQAKAYSLKNGKRYIANLYVYTSDGQKSLASNDVLFYCYKTPTFKFTNFKKILDNEIAIIENCSVDLTVKYDQVDGEPLSTYKFELQDNTNNIIFSSGVKYSTLSNDILRCNIGGMEEVEQKKNGEIIFDKVYKIICSGQTKHGIEVYADQLFVVKTQKTGVGSKIVTEHIGDGVVKISSNYIVMNARCSKEPPDYILNEDGEPYAIDLRKEYVEFIDGFYISHPYEIIFDGEFQVGNLITLRSTINKGESNQGYEYAYIKLIKVDYTIFPYYCFSFETERNNVTHEIRSNYFFMENNLIPAMVDVSHYNYEYNITVDLGVSYTSNYKDGFVSIMFTDSVECSLDYESVNIDGIEIIEEDGIVSFSKTVIKQDDNEENVIEEENVEIIDAPYLVSEMTINTNKNTYMVGETVTSLPIIYPDNKQDDDPNDDSYIDYIKIQNGIYNELYITRINENVSKPNTFTIPDKWTEETYLHALFNGNLYSGNSDFGIENTKTMLIKRREKDSYTWFTLFEQPINSSDDFNFYFEDKFAASGVEYEYAAVPIINGEEGTYSVIQCYVEFDSLVIIDNENIFSTIYDIEISQEKNNTSSIIIPIESKYPIYVSNAYNDYYTGNISATFLNMDCKNVNLTIKEAINYRKKILNFLNNRKVKFIKDPYGRCWLATIGTTISDDDNGHPLLHKVSFDFTEVGDINSNEDMHDSGLSDLNEMWWT